MNAKYRRLFITIIIILTLGLATKLILTDNNKSSIDIKIIIMLLLLRKIPSIPIENNKADNKVK